MNKVNYNEDVRNIDLIYISVRWIHKSHFVVSYFTHCTKLRNYSRANKKTPGISHLAVELGQREGRWAFGRTLCGSTGGSVES